MVVPRKYWSILGLPAKTLEAPARIIRDTVHEALKSRETSDDPKRVKDMMDMLIEAQSDGEQPLSESEVEDEVIMFLIAGHETSSNTLCWTIYELTKNPHCVEKIIEEVDRVLGDRKPEWGDLSKLKYIDWVLKECTNSLLLTRKVWVHVYLILCCSLTISFNGADFRSCHHRGRGCGRLQNRQRRTNPFNLLPVT